MQKSLAILGCLAFASTSHAIFNNGLENFSGQSLDSANWEVFSSRGGTPISQNGFLTIDGTDNDLFADYTTRIQTVAVGQKAGVDVRVNSYPPNDAGYAFIYLTSNSTGITHNTEWDDYHISIKSAYGAPYTYGDYGNGSAGFSVQPLMYTYLPVGTWFRLEIERTTSSTAKYNLLDANGVILGSATNTLLGTRFYPIAANPDPLYLSLFAQGASVSFDNVSIGAIPEPSVSMIFGVSGLMLRRRLKSRG